MCTSLLPCPLCTIPRFNDLESLRIGLIKVATENLACPICNDELMGLDKLTIHLFSHCENGVPKADSSQTDDKKSIEKSFHHPESPSNTSEIICQNDVVTSKRKTRNKGYHRVVNDELIDTKTNSNTEQLMKVFNMNTIPFIGVPENISTPQKTKKNNRITSEKNKNGRDGKLSEKCDICGFFFLGKNILEMHKKLIHNMQNSEIVNGVSKYCCHLCSKVFKMRGSLMVHLRMVHFGIIPSIDREEDSKCLSEAFNTNNICNSPEYDITISRDVNSDGTKSDFEALIAVNQTSDSQEHQNNNNVNVNNSQKQWTCDICKKQFTTKYFLKKHKRLHTGEMPYTCTQCNKSFTFQQSYHKHLLYHNDDKPHVCTHCGRAFKELSTLHNHQRIHTGEKPFSCETCGKCFRQRVSYLVHRRIHTGVMPYKCTSCDKSFRYKVSQRTHKCTAQPPGTLVRQSGDLVQKLIKNHKELKNTNNDDAGHEMTINDSKHSNHLGLKHEMDTFPSQNNNFIESMGHDDQQTFENDICCNGDVHLKDERRDEKCIIDELVNESLLKMNFTHPIPSTSHDFNSTVSDLYSMISPHNEIEDNLPSPSDKFKNMKLSSPENMLENSGNKQDDSNNTIDVSEMYHDTEEFDSINHGCFVNKRNCNQFNMFHEPSFQRR